MERKSKELGCAAAEKEVEKAVFLLAWKKARKPMGQDILLFPIPLKPWEMLPVVTPAQKYIDGKILQLVQMW